MRALIQRLDRALTRRPVPIMCFAASAAALIAALLGSLINYVLAEVMAVGGMLVVGLVFLGLGWLHRHDGSEPGLPASESSQQRPSLNRHRAAPADAAQSASSRGLGDIRDDQLDRESRQPVTLDVN